MGHRKALDVTSGWRAGIKSLEECGIDVVAERYVFLIPVSRIDEVLDSLGNRCTRKPYHGDDRWCGSEVEGDFVCYYERIPVIARFDCPENQALLTPAYDVDADLFRN